MTYSIQETNPDIITITYTGGVCLNERKAAIVETCKLLNQPDNVKLLIDVRKLIMKMSQEEQKYFAEYLSRKKELENARVAVLHNPESNPDSLINAFAYVRGHYSVDFVDKYEAIAWLNGDLR